MAVYLKSVAILVALLGVLAGTRFTLLVANDEEYSRAALLRDRNAGNLLFESEFRVAAAGHVFLIYSAVGAFMGLVWIPFGVYLNHRYLYRAQA